MTYFVFRNNTLENILGTSLYSYSGYDDISFIPQDVKGYIWFYQVPYKSNLASLSEEIGSYRTKLQLIAQQIPSDKLFVILSLENLFNLHFIDGDFELKREIEFFNEEARTLASMSNNVRFIDFSAFLADYKQKELIDWKYFFISQLPFSPKLARPFQKWVSKQLDQIQLKRKKCLVLDLDNTLWGGILGEDGINGIKIGGDYPGKSFLFFQEALGELTKYGIILSICSKNNEQDVFEAWEKNPFIYLKQNFISAYRINWQNKADNIIELAEELNIGLDSIVFIDDNPSERELVKQRLPMVEVPDFPLHPYELPLFFKQIVDEYFRVYHITDEDKQKTNQYKQNAIRRQASKGFSDIKDFIASLDIQINIEAVNEFNISRISQMTQKTNQFNLTTKRYSETDIKGFVDSDWNIYCISVKDKFGDNGITGAIFFKGTGDILQIDSFLLSCRILGKGIENAFLKYMLNYFKSNGYKKVISDYYPTQKNSQVIDFYEKNGFLLNQEDLLGNKSYELELENNKFEIEDYYQIKMNL